MMYKHDEEQSSIYKQSIFKRLSEEMVPLGGMLNIDKVRSCCLGWDRVEVWGCSWVDVSYWV